MSDKNINLDRLMKEAEKGSLEDFLNKNLNEKTKVKLRNILSDKTKTEQMLSTPQAKELMKKISRDK